MIINEKEKENVLFEVLCAGNVFRKLNSKDIFLKIHNTDTEGKFNCVNLSQDKLDHVKSTTCVEMLNAKLIIE